MSYTENTSIKQENYGSQRSRERRVPVVILGAGLAGLSTAFHLTRKPSLLVEREQEIGGHARSEHWHGYTFDVTGHWLHLRDPRVRALVDRLFRPGDLVEIERKASVFSHGALVPYPFQANLFGLPPEVVQECLVGFVEAREAAAAKNGAPPSNFEEYALARFGKGITRYFFVPYNTKLWGMHPNCLTSAWVSRYIPEPQVHEVIGGAIGLPQEGLGYNPRFLHPKDGGIDALPKALMREIQKRGCCELRTSTNVEEVDLISRRVKLDDSPDWIYYDALISTIPLPELIRRIPHAPKHIQQLSNNLRCVNWRYVNVATRTPSPAKYHWVYVPEECYPFFRVGIFSNAVPSMAPPGGASLYVELTERDGVVQMSEILQSLAEIGTITAASDVILTNVREIKYAYVVFDDAYDESTKGIHQWLKCVGMLSHGRYGAWVYNSMEDSIIQGMEAALWANSA